MTDIITSIIVLIIVVTIAAIVFSLIWKKGFKKRGSENETYENGSIVKGNFREQAPQNSTVKPWLKIESAFTHEEVFVTERLNQKYGLLIGSGSNCDVRLNNPIIPEEYAKLGNDDQGFFLSGRKGKKLRLVDGTEKSTVDLPQSGIKLSVGSDIVTFSFPCVKQADQPQTLVRRLE